MQIAQVMAGYSLGEADILRKAMGKKDKAIMAKQQAEFVAGAVKKGVESATRPPTSSSWSTSSRATASTRPHRGLRARRLLHRLPQGQLPRGVPGRLHDARLPATPTSSPCSRRRRRSRGIAILPPCINASEVDFLAEPRAAQAAGRHPLLAGRAQEHRRAGGREHRRRAQAQRAASRTSSDFAARAEHQGAQQARAGDACRRRRLRRARAQPRARARQRRAACWRSPTGSAANAAQGIGDLFGGGGERRGRRSTCGPLQGLDADGAAAFEFEAVGFFLSGHPLDAYAARARRSSASSTYAEFEAAAERGADGGPARRHRRLGARAALAEGQQVRLRHVLRAHRPVRGGDLLRDAGRLAAHLLEPGTRGAAHGRGRARRRGR